MVSVPGREKGKRVGLCAHIDTLGLMVRSITADGMLMTTRIGGPILPTLDGGVLPHPHQGRPDIHRNHPVSVPGGPRL